MEHNDKVADKLIDLELAKSDNKNTKVKKYLPAIVLMTSVYYSVLLASGLAIGYIVTKLYSKYLLENGKVDSIYIECGKYKIHLHHWIMGAVFLLLVWVVDKAYLSSLFVGMVLGMMAHDVYDFNDWHKVLVKNEDYQATK